MGDNRNIAASYTYDAWGKVLSITGSGTIGAINPIRYRGYYFDTETGLYYLQSRYYDPETGRFISADDTDYMGAGGTVLSYNLFAYCENDPVNSSDPTGYYGWWDFYRARWFVAGTINLLISLAVGGAIPAIGKSLTKLAARQGRYAAKKWLTTQIQAKFARTALKTAFKSKIVNIIGVVFTVATAFLDIGGWIFDYIDARDKRPRNGYWDF